MKHLAAPFPSFLRRLAVLALVYGLCATAAHAQPTVTAPAISNLGANQVTLTLRSSATGTGYFTLLTGSETAGTPAQTAAGQILGGAAAFRHGSLPLTAATNGTYTVCNLSSNTHYAVCFTAADTSPSRPGSTPRSPSRPPRRRT
ncbi:MAG: hypothetical protein IPL39_07725 [Opitutaceae bacterium]|nr:hypothetical protein [Opitutaceae bacterium]